MRTYFVSTYLSYDNCGLAGVMFRGNCQSKKLQRKKKMLPGGSSTQHPLECSQGSGLEIHLVASALTKFTQKRIEPETMTKSSQPDITSANNGK